MPIFNQNNFNSIEEKVPIIFFTDKDGNVPEFDDKNHDFKNKNLVSKFINLIYEGFY